MILLLLIYTLSTDRLRETSHSISINPTFWIWISLSIVDPLKWPAPTFKEQLIPHTITICSNDCLRNVTSGIRRSSTENTFRDFIRSPWKAEGCMYWNVCRAIKWNTYGYTWYITLSNNIVWCVVICIDKIFCEKDLALPYHLSLTHLIFKSTRSLISDIV